MSLFNPAAIHWLGGFRWHEPRRAQGVDLHVGHVRLECRRHLVTGRDAAKQFQPAQRAGACRAWRGEDRRRRAQRLIGPEQLEPAQHRVQSLALRGLQRGRDRLRRTRLGDRSEDRRADGDPVRLVRPELLRGDLDGARTSDPHAVERAVQAILGPGIDLVEIARQAGELGLPAAPQEGGLIEALVDEVGKRFSHGLRIRGGRRQHRGALVDLNLASLDAIGPSDRDLDVGAANDDAAVAPQGHRRAAALQHDLVLRRHPHALAVHVRLDDRSGFRRLRRGRSGLQRLDEADDDRSRPIAVLEEDDGLLTVGDGRGNPFTCRGHGQARA